MCRYEKWLFSNGTVYAKEVNVKKKSEGGKIYFESSISSTDPIVTAEKIIYGEYTCSYNKKVTCKK